MSNINVNETKPKKRKTHYRTHPIVIIGLVLLILTVAVTFLYIFLDSTIDGNFRLKGKWERKIDLTDEVVANVMVYLSDIEDADIQKEDLESRIGKVELTSTMTFEGTYGNDLICSESINEEEYSEIKKAVYEGLAEEMGKYIGLSLKASGYNYEDYDRTVEEIAEEALGMSVFDYISSLEVDIVPSYEILCERCNFVGNYKTDADKITFIIGDMSFERNFQVDKDSLIIYSEEVSEGDTPEALKDMNVVFRRN